MAIFLHQIKDVNGIIMEIGKFKDQKEGFKAFIPNNFPLDKDLTISQPLILKHSTAERLLGKLYGITQLLLSILYQ